LSEAALALLAGDPDGTQPASFSRFVLPFAWRRIPESNPIADGDAHWLAGPPRTTAERLYARRTYFTPETTLVLFDRALWLREIDGPERNYTVAVGDRNLTLTIEPPRAVLFEFLNPGIAHLDTGFLIVDITFPAPARFDHLLLLNEAFRFWRKPYHDHDPALCLGGNVPVYGALWKRLLRLPVRLENGDTIRLVTDDDLAKAGEWIEKGRGPSGWICYTDARAFVYSCAITARGSRDLDRSAGSWVQFVNVDKPSTRPATPFEQKWARERTYDRWQDSGTLYGFSTHSAVMLGSPWKAPDTWQHFADMYFDQVLLLLYLRVTTFRFSSLLSDISTRLASPRRRETDAVRREFAALRREFALFTNLYRFPLLSNQQQGIEMYSKARQALDVDQLFEEVQKEIASTHELFELTIAARHQEAATFLGWIAALASAAGIALAFAATDVGAETARTFAAWFGQVFPASRVDGRFVFTSGTAAALFAPLALWRFFRRNG
jgi:hypothetical protein